MLLNRRVDFDGHADVVSTDKSGESTHLAVAVLAIICLGGLGLGFFNEAQERSCLAHLEESVNSLATEKDQLSIICSISSKITQSDLLIPSNRVFLFRFGNLTSMTKLTVDAQVVEDPRERSFYTALQTMQPRRPQVISLSPDTTVPGAVALRMFCYNGLQYFGANVNVRALMDETCFKYSLAYDDGCEMAGVRVVWSTTLDAVTLCIVKSS